MGASLGTVQSLIEQSHINPIFTGTSGLVLPRGTTAQRPSNPQVGLTRFNTSLSASETWDGSSWIAGGGGAPSDAQFLVLAVDGDLTQERTLGFNATNFLTTDAGAGGAFTVNTVQNIASTSSPTFAGLTVTGLSASRLVATNGFSDLASVADLTSWIAGTTNQISVAADGDGSVTLSLASGIYRTGGTDVAVADGGTGVSSWGVGDLVHATGATTLAGLAAVASGSLLASAGLSTAAAWSTSPTVGGFTVSNAATPTYTLTDTTDGNSAKWTRTDALGLASHTNTVEQGGNSSCIDFNVGTSDYVSFSSNPAALKIGTGTISLWIKTSDAGSGYRGVLIKASAYGIYLNANIFIIYDWSTGDRSTGVNVADGTWKHLAVTFNSGVVNGTKLYINGSLSLTTTMTVVHQNSNITIGSGGGGGQLFDGLIDECVIFNRALTGPEVADLYNSGAGLYAATTVAFPSTSTSMGDNLVGLWHLDDGSGTAVTDSSTTGLTGLLNGSATWVAGKVEAPGVDYEVSYLTSQDGGPGIRGKTTLGNSLGDTYINGLTNYFQVGGTNEMILTAAALYPSANDGLALGASGLAWADAYWASGVVHDFGAGNYTVTHSTGKLLFSGTLGMTTGVIAPATVFSVDAVAFTNTAAANLYRATVASTNAITLNTGTVPVLAGLAVLEPNVTIGTGSAAITASLYVPGAATEGTDNYAFLVDDGPSRFDDRILGFQGADVTAANDTTLTKGNYFDITGATTINGIAIAGWTAGSIVTLQFDSTPTVKHNTAASAGFASILLAGSGDFSATAGDTLTLRYDGTTWREIARTVI